MATFLQPNAPSSNYWSQVKNFAGRGGFYNGLNPAVVGRIWYVNANTQTDRTIRRGPIGYDGNDGRSPLTPFATIAKAFTVIDCYDTIVLDGNIKEQVVAPAGVFDVTIIGAANTPRQATSGGVATGGGACWLPPASPTAATPLLELTRQGWAIYNVKFTPHTSSAAVRLTSSPSVDLIDASHALFDGCYFGGEGGSGQIGIEDNQGCSFVIVRNCRFALLTGTAILALATGTRVPLNNLYEDNRFSQNTNDIKMSLNYSVIRRNSFMTAGSGATNKVISTTFISTQGGNNHILLNQFSNTEAQIAPGNGYTGASTDTWMNYVNDQAALAFGQPA